MMSELEVQGFASWAIDQHVRTNHFYDKDLPYRFHLQMVENEVEYFREDAMEQHTNLSLGEFRCAAWGHDLMEDCRITYGDIVKQGVTDGVANIIYAVTNEKGKTRDERANDKYYELIRKTPGASFIKLCDRIANVKYGVMMNSSMVKKYKQENEHFKSQLYKKSLSGMFAKLDRMFAMVGPPCSGKSTIARKVVKEDFSYVRINRDDIRFMLRGMWTHEKKLEKLIDHLTRETVKYCLENHKNIIIDATHCKERYINDIKAMIPEGTDHTIEYIVCDIPYWKQRLRNIWRCIKQRIWIPKQCSIDMNRNFQEIKQKIKEGKI